MRQKIKITDKKGLSILHEIHAINDSFPVKLRDIRLQFEKEWSEFQEAAAKQIEENLERLRMHLSLPELPNPRVETHNLDIEIGVLSYGPPPEQPAVRFAGSVRVFL